MYLDVDVKEETVDGLMSLLAADILVERRTSYERRVAELNDTGRTDALIQSGVRQCAGGAHV